MITTIDGKTVSGARDESVVDLGSATDHAAMRQLESLADAVMVGASTLRSTGPVWNPRSKIRVVVTAHGNVPFDSAFLSQGEPYLAVPADAKIQTPPNVGALKAGSGTVDFVSLFQKLRSMGVRTLLVLGGSELNGQILHLDLVDELFLTMAPKIKLGRDLPTYAGGEPLDGKKLLSFGLMEHHVVGSELFLRYRRERELVGN
jgi:2,5-diamino-6-(ribosylamino)-4(3H)-pyrimidinone 5'-phosphate reductase